jgi:shikimate 5-dehydrogenase
MNKLFSSDKKHSLIAAMLFFCICIGLSVQFEAWGNAQAQNMASARMPKQETDNWFFVKREVLTKSGNLYFDVFANKTCETLVKVSSLGMVSHHAPIMEQEFKGLQRLYASETMVQEGIYRPWELRLGRFAERLGFQDAVSGLPTGQILMIGIENPECYINTKSLMELRSAMHMQG